MVLQCEWALIQVVVLTNDGNGFGFGISGSRNSGAVVRNIFPGGAADRDGTLQNGDHLLAVGEVRLWGMGAEQVASILRQAGQDSIRLVIARPIDPTIPHYAVNSAIVPTKVLSDPVELERTLQSGLTPQPNGYAFDTPNGAFSESFQPNLEMIPNDVSQVLSLSSGSDVPTIGVTTNVPLPLQPTTTAMASTSSLDPLSSIQSTTPPVHTVVTQMDSGSTVCLTTPTVVPSPPPPESAEPTEAVDPADVILPPPRTIIEIHTNTVKSSRSSSVKHSKPVSTADVPRSNSMAEVITKQPKKAIPQSATHSGALCDPGISCSNVELVLPPAVLTNHPLNGTANVEHVNETNEEEVNGEEDEDDEAVLPEKEEYNIALTKNDKGLGITVAGYVCEKEDLCGIFVKSVIEGSMADKSGCIMVNDQIIEVDGVPLCGFSNQEAVEILKRTGQTVKLKIVRYLRGLKFEELQEGVSNASAVTPSTTPISPSESTNIVPGNLQNQSSSKTSLSGGPSLDPSPAVPLLPSMQQRSTNHNKVLPLTSTSFDDTLGSEPAVVHDHQRRSVPNIFHSSKDLKLFANGDTPSAVSVVSGNGTSVNTIKAAVEDDEKKERLVLKWEAIMGPKFTIVVSRLHKTDPSGGLGISLEGTVDVEDGREVRPHHYIRSILPGGPVGKAGVLQSGDELLEVNGTSLKGLFHEEVVRTLKELPAEVCLVCGRKASGPSPIRGTIVDNVDTGRSEQAFASRKILSGSLQSLLAQKEPELLIKAKSEVSLSTVSQSLSVSPSYITSGGVGGTSSGSVQPPRRTRSLEQLNCMAMWSDLIEEIVLQKAERGLGFSILDYQDPLNANDTVIVVRSLVPSGVAQQDGRLVPGDRIIFVNDIQLEHACLDAAVQALKGAPFGPVRIGIARPIPATDDTSTCTSAEPSESVRGSSISDTIADGSNFSDLKTDNGNDNAFEAEVPRQSDLTRGELKLAQDIQILPHLPKYTICIKKSPYEFLGLQLEALAFELCGTLVRRVDPGGAVARDGRLRTGDLVIYLNNELMWRVTSSQAKIILRRAELISTDIPVVFVPEEELVPSEEDSSVDSFSESLKLSDIQEDPNESSSSSSESSESTSVTAEVIVPDLTVHSAASLTRFPSDLLETSVDPIERESLKPSSTASTLNEEVNQSLDDLASFPNDADDTMVRVYNPPPSLPGIKPGHVASKANGFKSPSSPEPLTLRSPGNKVWGPPRSVDVYRLPNVGLGISIVGGKVEVSKGSVGATAKSGSVSGIFIKNVLPDSPAGRTEQLFTGDRVIEVGGVALNSSDHEAAVAAIRNAGNPVKFVVQSLKTASSLAVASLDVSIARRHSETILSRTLLPGSVPPDRPHSATRSDVQSPPLNDSDDEELNSDNPFQNDTIPIWQQQPKPAKEMDSRGASPSQTSTPENSQVQPYNYDYKHLNETPASPDLMTHRKGLDAVKGNGDVAKDNGRLSPHYSKKPSSGSSTPSGSEVLTPPGTPEVIQAGLSDIERQQIQQKIDAEIVNQKEQHLTVYSKGNAEGAADDLISDMQSVHVNMDSRPKARDFKSIDDSDESEEEEDEAEYTEERINELEDFKSLPGDLITVELTRNKFGFGLALSGHKDRMRMGTYICGINPSGAAAEEGSLQPGDELLKFHKTVVRGRCHLNVSAIIKHVPEDATVKVIALRHEKNHEKVAVKKVCQFPMPLDDSIFDWPEFADYRAKREIKIQKTTEGLGIMIIEGSHKTVGKGIFVSDIQEQSVACKAGLKVGDMLLAVNTETFLDVTYDEAVMILKQLSGNIRFLVTNPKEAEAAMQKEAEEVTEAVDEGAAQSTTLAPPDSDLKPGSPAKSPAKTPAKSPAKTPAKTPAKSPAKAAEDKIEIKKDNAGLGLSIVGGSDTPLGSIFVHEVYRNGAADKDARLKPGDHIKSVNGSSFEGITHKEALRILRTSHDKVTFVVDHSRVESDDLYQDLEVELCKKAGKGLGLSVVGRRDGTGVFISDMVSGGIAEANGQLLRGDQIMAVNGKDLSASRQDQAVAVLKTTTGNVNLKVRRLKNLAA